MLYTLLSHCLLLHPPDKIWLKPSAPRHCPGSALRRSDWPTLLRWTTHTSSRSPNWPKLQHNNIVVVFRDKYLVNNTFSLVNTSNVLFTRLLRGTIKISNISYIIYPLHSHFLAVKGIFHSSDIFVTSQPLSFGEHSCFCEIGLFLQPRFSPASFYIFLTQSKLERIPQSWAPTIHHRGQKIQAWTE